MLDSLLSDAAPGMLIPQQPDMDSTRSHTATQDPELATPPPRSSASYASSGGLPPFFDQSSSGIITTPNTSAGLPTPAKGVTFQQQGGDEGHADAGPSTVVAETDSGLLSHVEPPAEHATPLPAEPQHEFVEPSAPSPVSTRQETPAPPHLSQASTGDTTASEASPLKAHSPEQQLFSVTGRPARSASAKKVVYSVDWDREGNPVKSADEKQREKQRKEDEKARKAAERQQERQRKAEEKEQEKQRKAAEREAKKNAKKAGGAASSSAGPSSSSGSHSANDGHPASSSPNTFDAHASGSGSAPTRRSGRQTTAAPDRHRSSHREEKAAARRRKAAAALAVSSDEEEEEEEDGEEEGADNQQDVSAPPVDAAQSDDEMDILRDQGEASKATEGDEEEDVRPPQRSTKRARQTSARQPEVEVPSPPKKAKFAGTTAGRHSKATADADAVAAEEDGEEGEEETADGDDSRHIIAASSSSSSSSSKDAPRKRATADPPTPQTPVNRPHLDSSSSSTGRRSFSGTPLSSLLTSSNNRHRRPGLGRKSFIPPLHPNRQPAPPPKVAPPSLTRKERDALEKERKKRAEDGSDSDSDDENKPKYDPFEEEIEGY